jgi:hypothetical protein
MKQIHVFRSLCAAPIAALIALSLGACNLYDGREDHPALGIRVSKISDPVQLGLWQNHMLVAHCGYNTGVSITDAAMNRVTKFYAAPEGQCPKFAVNAENVLVINSGRLGVRAVSLVTGKSKQLLPVTNTALRTLWGSNGRLFVQDAMTGLLSKIVGSNLESPVAFSEHISGLAVQNGKLFIGREGSGVLRIWPESGGDFDSLDIATLFQDGLKDTAFAVETIVGHEGRIFVKIHRNSQAPVRVYDYFVAVLNASTYALEKTIPLGFGHYHAPGAEPRIANGIWYLPGGATGGPGGVEAVNLNTREHAGMPVTLTHTGSDSAGASGEERTLDFLLTQSGASYVVYHQVSVISPYVKKIDP